MTPTKKLFLATAILATGFALAILFAAPRAMHVPPSLAPGSAVEASASSPAQWNPAQSLAGPIGIDTTQLLPEEPPAEAETPADAGATVPAPSAEVAQSAATPQVLGRLVGIRAALPPAAADPSPRGPLVALPQVTVQVSSAKPVYAVVDYPQIVSAVGSRAPEPPTQAPLIQALLNTPADTVHEPFADPWAGPAAAAEHEALRTHVIVDGDSLQRLAERYLDDPERSEEIFLMNEGRLTDPELLPIGLELKIPPRSARTNSTATWNSPAGASTSQSGLVPVYEIPGSGSTAPRAQLMRPMPASWPDQQPGE